MYFGDLSVSEILEILDYIFSKENTGEGVYELYKTVYWLMRNMKYDIYTVSDRSMVDVSYCLNRDSMVIKRKGKIIGQLRIYYFISWYEECKELLNLGEEFIYIESVFNILLAGSTDFLHRHKYLSKTVLGENSFELMKSEVLLKPCMDVSKIQGAENSPVAIIVDSDDMSNYIIKIFDTVYRVKHYDKAVIVLASVELNKEDGLVSIKVNKFGKPMDFLLFYNGELVYASDDVDITKSSINFKRYVLLGEGKATFYKSLDDGGIQFALK